MIDSEISSLIPDWAPRDHSSRNNFRGKAILEDGDSRVAIVMERLPSGRKYWSDSPKASSESSPLKFGPSNLSLAESVTSRDSLSEENSPPISRKDNCSCEGSALRHVDYDSDHDGCVKLEADSVCSNSQSDDIDQGVDASGNGSLQLEKNTPIENDSVDIKNIVKNFEHMLDEQQKELDELKKKHELAVLDLLTELPQEIRSRVLSICNRNRSEHKFHN